MDRDLHVWATRIAPTLLLAACSAEPTPPPPAEPTTQPEAPAAPSEPPLPTAPSSWTRLAAPSPEVGQCVVSSEAVVKPPAVVDQSWVVGGTFYGEGRRHPDVIFDETGFLFAVDVATGKTRWTHPLGYSSSGATPYITVHASGMVLVHFEGPVTMLDAQTGKQRWKIRMREPVAALSTAPRAAVVLYSDESAVALSPDTGKELWRRPCTGIRVDTFNGLESLSLYDSGRGTVAIVDPATGADLVPAIHGQPSPSQPETDVELEVDGTTLTASGPLIEFRRPRTALVGRVEVRTGVERMERAEGHSGVAVLGDDATVLLLDPQGCISAFAAANHLVTEHAAQSYLPVTMKPGEERSFKVRKEEYYLHDSAPRAYRVVTDGLPAQVELVSHEARIDRVTTDYGDGFPTSDDTRRLTYALRVKDDAAPGTYWVKVRFVDPEGKLLFEPRLRVEVPAAAPATPAASGPAPG